MKKNSLLSRLIGRIALDETGAVLIETAIALPILSLLLSGIVSYGMYFMAAHGLQNVANEGARASIAGLDAGERDQLVSEAIQKSILQASLVDPEKVAVQTSIDGAFYTVKLDFDAHDNVIFKNSLVPLPSEHIVRSSTVELPIY